MARRPGSILASLTVGELAFLRVVGRWHRDGSPFCSTEVTRRYSLTSLGVGGYSEFREYSPELLRDSKGMVLPRRDAATEDEA